VLFVPTLLVGVTGSSAPRFCAITKKVRIFCAINILEDSFGAPQSIDDDFQLLVALVVIVVADMEI
jgi:hypothetical protein